MQYSTPQSHTSSFMLPFSMAFSILTLLLSQPAYLPLQASFSLLIQSRFTLMPLLFLIYSYSSSYFLFSFFFIILLFLGYSRLFGHTKRFNLLLMTTIQNLKTSTDFLVPFFVCFSPIVLSYYYLFVLLTLHQINLLSYSFYSFAYSFLFLSYLFLMGLIDWIEFFTRPIIYSSIIPWATI